MDAIKSRAAGLVFGLGAAAIRSPFLRSLRERFYRRRANIVYYHGVWQPGDPRHKLFGGIALDRLAADLDSYARYFSVIALGRLLDDRDHAEELPRPPLAICFDDGFDLVGSGASELLAQRGIPATAFVCQDAYAGDGLLWQHALQVVRTHCGDAAFVDAFNTVQQEEGAAERIHTYMDYHATARNWSCQDQNAHRAGRLWNLAKLEGMSAFRARHQPYMEESALRTWLDHGHELGCHSRSHPFSSGLDEQQLQREFLLPAQDLQERFGTERPALAYPFGDRASPALEAILLDSSRYSFRALLGTHRLSRRTELASGRLDRVEVEFDMPRALYGEPPLQALRGRA